jgi:recombinational DNA repair protein RecR
MLMKHLKEMADKGCKLAVEAQYKVKEWKNNQSEDLAGTTGDTDSESSTCCSTRAIHL